MFFNLPTEFIVKNLKSRNKLRKFFKIDQVLEAQEIYDYLQKKFHQKIHQFSK